MLFKSGNKTIMLATAWKTCLVLITMLISLASFTSAQAQPDHVLINSADWRDVYSGVIYANLLGVPNNFLTSTPHGPIILYEISKDKQNIEVITSADKPFVVGYSALIRSRGYENPTELIYDRSNLELARKLPNINKFIIMDDSYGYNALAVAPFAVRGGYYVLFVDSTNIRRASEFLSSKNVEEIIIYGQVDREVRTAMASYSPEVLNSETGSRFENNMMIVDKFSEIGSIKQVILTNGEFIESSMMSGKEAVLFIGKTNVPDEVASYIKSKGIDIGVLIGNELIGSATTIRRQLGISVFVKFARGARIPGGTINPVEDLDRFPMPSYRLSLSIVSIVYNKATRSLEVTYQNNVDIATYFKTTLTIRDAEGNILAVNGSVDIEFIDGGDAKTVVYSMNIGDIQGMENLTGEVYTIYGESKKSLENVLRGTFPIEQIEVLDTSDLEIIGLVYDAAAGRFIVTIKNTGDRDIYVDVELVDLWINGEYVTVSADEVEKIGPGETKKIYIKIKLEEEDLEDERNSKITVRAVYGERKHALINTKTQEFDLELKKFALWIYIPIIIVLIILIFFIILLIRRRKRCRRCRTWNKKSAHNCKKCGHPFHHSH